MQKNRIWFVHGGMTFPNQEAYIDFLKSREIDLEEHRGWKDTLIKKLHRIYDAYKLKMPLAENAKYRDWKIHFERYRDFFQDGDIFIGSSLGGVFLAKYFSENRLNTQIGGIYLVAAPFDNSLPGEDLVGGFTLRKNISTLTKHTKHIELFFGAFDPVVPISHAYKYSQALAGVKIHVLKDIVGHFEVSEIKELYESIRKNYRKKFKGIENKNF